MMYFYDMTNDNLPALEDNINTIENNTTIEHQIHNNLINHIEENGYDNVTFKAATVYNRKNEANFTEIGKPKNHLYSSDNDAFIIQVSVRVEPGDMVYDKMKSLDRYMSKVREDKELVKKQKRVDEARIAFEKAQQELEDAQRSI